MDRTAVGRARDTRAHAGCLAAPGLGWLSAFWLLLVAGRYADVTAPALYGRDVNLYWDLRFLPDVAAMVTIVAPRWQLLLGVAAVGVAAVGSYAAIRWAIGRLCEALEIRGARRLLAVASISVVAGFTAQEGRARESWDVTRSWFPLPVTVAFSRQLGLALAAMTTSRALPPSPPMNSDLGLVKDADVYVVFVESYGGQLGTARLRRRPTVKPCRARGGHPRDRPPGGVGVCRVADLRR